MPVSSETYEDVALSDPEGHWELHRGQLRRKPDMTQEHNDAASILGFRLQEQLPLEQYRVRVNMARARRDEQHSYIPDVMVVPVTMMAPRSSVPGGLERYDDPLPLVVEVWSPSTGDYDVDDKLPEYMRRGDREIWRVHPYERTVTVWRRSPSGDYTRSDYGIADVVSVSSLPGVVIAVHSLFM
ncbi:MAG: Uma2 family endonuclease [Dehalococcoidia bacterium]